MDTDRILAIDGGLNFRSLAGYEVASGGRVAEGRLFRSGHFSDVTTQGWEQLKALNIATVIDLREPFEHEALPTPWPGSAAPEIIVAGRARDGTFDNAAMLAWDDDLDLKAARQRRVAAYRRKPDEYAAAIGLLFRSLYSFPGQALVFHCVGGKDRTGLVAAVILDWLGVGRDVIMDDYLLSASHAGTLSPDRVRRIIEMYGLQQSTLDSIKALIEVRSEYLEAALDRIDELGGVHRYLTQRVGLADETLEHVQSGLIAA